MCVCGHRKSEHEDDYGPCTFGLMGGYDPDAEPCNCEEYDPVA